jgi:ATP-binding cassette subfamily F protein 3
MIILRLDNVSFSHPGGLVLENLAWVIQDTDKVGLVGPNGAGKSTILKLLAGQLVAEKGFVAVVKGVTLGYLPQEVTLDPAKTVLAEALTASPELAAIEAELQQVEAELGDPAVYGDESALTKVLDRQSRLLTAYEEAGGLSYENTVMASLRRLGFSESDLTLPTHVLSGGQKKLLALAKLAVNRPTVLLLDEPDNHLDLAGKVYLEKFIRTYSGAVVIVSHDRYLLDEVAEGMVELAGGKLEFYTVNYSAYISE